MPKPLCVAIGVCFLGAFICLRGEDVAKKCSAIQPKELTALQHFIQAKDRLPMPPEITIEEVQADCFTKLSVIPKEDAERSVARTLFLDPDHVHLFPEVFDVRIDPSVIVHREEERLKRLVVLGARRLRGTESAPVQVVVYSDFQCPYCAKFWKTLRPYLIADDQGIAISIRSSPIEGIHPWAHKAAVMSKCVERQGDLYLLALSDWLFDNQKTITVDNLSARVAEFLREERGFDQSAFESCMSSPAAEAEVSGDQRSAREVRLGAVPTVFINGRGVRGAVPPERFKTLLAEAATPRASTGLEP